MNRIIALALVACAAAFLIPPAFALSESLPHPKIFLPKGYDPNRADAIHAVLRSDKFKYLNGLTSYWEPKWSTTLVYDGDAATLTRFIGALNQVHGLSVRLTFSRDLAKETGSALSAGSWWVKYEHTMPDTITVRVNLAAESLGGEKFELILPKASR